MPLHHYLHGPLRTAIRRVTIFVVGLIVLFGSVSFGQPPQGTPSISYQGQQVSVVDFAGRPDIQNSQLTPLLQQASGQPYSQAKVDATIAALKRSGQFQDVQANVRPEPAGLRVEFLLQPAMYFGMYRFSGVDGFSYSQMLQVSNYSSEEPYSEVDLQKARDGLQTYFRRNGYFQATVQSEIQTDSAHGLVNVTFQANLGDRAKIGSVTLAGPTPAETAHLQQVLKSWMARLHGSALRPGKTYSIQTLQKATQYLENSLIKQKRLAARVRLIGATYNPESKRADISFSVDTGPLVHVKIEGAHLWSWTERRLLPVYQQNGLNSELIQEGRQNLISHFQSQGYFDVKVDVQTHDESAAKDIRYQVREGPRRKITGVQVTGNEHISEKELLPHVLVRKQHLFLHGNYDAKSVKNLESVYQAAGFNSVKITPQFILSGPSGNDVVVTFQVREGPQDTVASLKIAGNDTLQQAQFAPKGLKLTAGRPYSQKSINDDHDQIVSQYLQLGYLAASFKETAEPLPNQPHAYQVVYTIYEGPEVRAGNIVTVGREHTVQRLIDRDTEEIQATRPLTDQGLLGSESRLYDTGVFDWAQVDPRRQITTQKQEDVVIKVHESSRNEITYGVGFELVDRSGNIPSGSVALPGLPPIGLPNTFVTSEGIAWGPRVSFEYTRKNLFGKAAAVSLAGLAGPLDRRGSLTYTDPSFRWTSWKSSLTASGDDDKENPIFTARQTQFGWQLERPLGKSKTQHIALRYSFSEIGLVDLLIPALVPAADLHTRLSTFTISYSRDTRNNLLNAQKGAYESAELDLNPSVLGSSVSFAKLLSQAAFYHDIHKGIIWANSARIGLAQPFAGSHVPISQAFFTGGGSTLRGFPLNGAGPQQSIPACGTPSNPATCAFIEVPTGGNQLLILNTELRFPLPVKKGLALALFYDGGNVYARIGFHDLLENYTNSVGLGLRYLTPVGPIRVDLGHNVNRLPGVQSTQIFITLGQAF